jgi:hypothetical protein
VQNPAKVKHRAGATSARVVEGDVTQTKSGKTPSDVWPVGLTIFETLCMDVIRLVKAACQRAHLGPFRRLTDEEKIIALFDMEHWASDQY